MWIPWIDISRVYRCFLLFCWQRLRQADPLIWAKISNPPLVDVNLRPERRIPISCGSGNPSTRVSWLQNVIDVIVFVAGRCGYPAAGCGKGIRWGLGFWGCDSYHQSESLSSHMAFFLKDFKWSTQKKTVTSIATPKKIKKSQLSPDCHHFILFLDGILPLYLFWELSHKPAVHVWGLFGSSIPPGVERKILQRPGAGGAGGAGGITKELPLW